MASQKISVYSLADLKNTSDDAIPNYLNSLKFKQSHTLTDVRLALGYSALAVAGACFAWDYKLGWDATKLYTAAAVALYMLLNSALSCWMWFVENGKIYVGTSPQGEKIEISTSTAKNIPTYHLKITTYTPKPQTIKLSHPFSEWFDASGNFVAIPFQQIFANGVPMIGAADPTKVTQGSKAVPQAPFTEQELLKNLTALSSNGTKIPVEVSTSTTNSGKKSKARKKA